MRNPAACALWQLIDQEPSLHTQAHKQVHILDPPPPPLCPKEPQGPVQCCEV